MTTPDRGERGASAGMPVEELRLLSAAAPEAAVPPRSPAIGNTTPGLSPAVLRVPTAPTLPDFDPSSLTTLVQRLANDLFTAPAGGPSLGDVDHPPSASYPAAPAPEGREEELGLGRAPASPQAAQPAFGDRGAELPYETTLPREQERSPNVASGTPSTPSKNAVVGSPDNRVVPRGEAPQPPSDARAIPAAPSGGHPSDARALSAPSSLPVGAPDVRSPWETPLDFASLGKPVDPFSAALAPSPGFDWIEGDRAPEKPRETPAVAPEERGLSFDRIEILPSSDPSIRSLGGSMFDPEDVRRQFPILRERVRGRPLIWLDNAATTQKPQSVIDRLSYFYEHENSNIHRAAHTLAARATDAYETARESARRFLNAPSAKEIIFVRGTTEGINLVAQSWGARHVREGDEIVITWLEHHANIVPWQMLCSRTGARLRVAPVNDRGEVILEEYEKLLSPATRLVSITQVSNALGTVTPTAEMVEMAHRHGAKVVVDGAQSVSHKRVDVQTLDCDFFVFSGHKIFGPTGIGVVFGKSAVLDETPPWQGGGNMIQDVTFERTVYQPPPSRFEAGTGNIADAVGLGAALDWVTRTGIERIEHYEHELLVYATERLRSVPGLTMIGNARDKAGVLSFVLAGQKTEEVGGMLDQEGIAVRSGHHCAQPILRRFGLEATVRASLAPYNTRDDIDALVAALRRIQSGQSTGR